MKARTTFRRLRIGIGVGMVTVAALGVGTVAAQTGYGGGQSQYRSRSSNGNSSSSGTTYALSAVVAKMSSAAGVQILADRAVANDSVTAPTATTTTANLDEQIKALVAQLPNGTVSGKFYLPASAKGGGYTAEAVEAFAMAEARLFGPVGGAETQSSGAVEVLGQTLSASKASTVVSDLNLQPVYLIGNPNSGANGGQYAQSGNYSNSTGANTSTSVSQQAQTLLGMSATERNQALTQMLSQNQQNQQVIGQVMQSLSATERQQLMQSMGGAMGGGGFGGGRGGFGGPGGGPR